jgi:hypothetical protein
MIDTDKYEGHTEGPWLIKYGRDDSTSKYDAFIYSGRNFSGQKTHSDGVLMFAATNNPYERFYPNLKLVADAPLLLAEVKRLRRVLEDIESMIPDNHEEVSPVLSDILNECHRVLPMFNEVIE